MKYELRRIEPVRAANVGALVYGLMAGAFMLIFLPLILLMSMMAPQTGPGPGVSFAVFMVLLYPVFGLIIGWISGLLSAAIYNLVVRWTGGVLFDIAGPPIPTDIESGMV